MIYHYIIYYVGTYYVVDLVSDCRYTISLEVTYSF